MPPTLYPCVVEEAYLRNIPQALRHVLAISVVTLVGSLFYVIPAAVVLAVTLAAIGHLRLSSALVVLLVCLATHPLREWPAARKFFQILYEPFGVRHNQPPERIRRVVEDCYLNGDRYILGMHPHGVFPIQALIWAAFADQYLATPELGTLYGFGGMASVIYRLPIIRSLMGWLTGTPRTSYLLPLTSDLLPLTSYLSLTSYFFLSPRLPRGTGMPATYANLKRGLTSGTGATFGRALHPGRNLYMLPGGLAEIFTARPNSHTAIWRPRKGLCRLALETGARLVPVYVFGGNDFYHQLLTDESAIARTSRAMGLSLTLFWGRLWWCPPVPLVPKHGVTITLAEPLPSRRCKGEAPTEEEIASLNAEYEAALIKLFNEHKGVCGYPDGELVVK